MNSIEVQNSLDFYKVVEIKGKGMGCIALKDIQRHSALEYENKIWNYYVCSLASETKWKVFFNCWFLYLEELMIFNIIF